MGLTFSGVDIKGRTECIFERTVLAVNGHTVGDLCTRSVVAAGEQGSNDAVLELHDSRGVVEVEVVAGHAVFFVNETVCACAVYGFGFAEQEAQLVEQVNVLFNDLTAAGFLLSPPPNTGNAAQPRAADNNRGVFLTEVLHCFGQVLPSVLETDVGEQTLFFDACENLFCNTEVESHRLFNLERDAEVDDGIFDFTVLVRGNCDEDDIGLDVVEHRLVVVINIAGAVLVSHCLCTGNICVAEADQINVFHNGELLKMNAVSAAAANESSLYFFHECFLHVI